MAFVLRDYQKNLLNVLGKNLNKDIFLVEAPTGSGKSVMISELVKNLKNEFPDKKIIVSTSTIHLAIELMKTFKSSLRKNESFEYDLIVGKDNYLNIDELDFSLIKDIVKSEVFLKELNNIFKENKNYSFIIDYVIEELSYLINDDLKPVLKELLKSENPLKIRDFEDVEVSFTNHFYLLHKFAFDKEFKNDYIVILDEVHLLNDVFELIFTNTFSLYRYNFLINKFLSYLKDEKFRGSLMLYKRFNKYKDFVEYVFQKHTDEKFVGKYFLYEEHNRKIVSNIVSKLHKPEVFKNFESYIQRTTNKEFLKIANLLYKEYKELSEISHANPKEVALFYSPTKGYPRLSITKETAFLYLRSFWDKIYKIFGFSATLNIDDDFKYIFYKLSLNGVKRNVFKTSIPPVFKKSQINVRFVDRNFPQPQRDEESVDMKYISALGDYVLNTFNKKNSLVLLGGYLEVEKLKEYIIKKLYERNDTVTNVINADRDLSIYETVQKFKKEGGILIATRNYSVGIDLKGKALENLYIAKLPYPVVSNKKWIELKQKDRLNKTSFSYFLAENEMLINLKQAVGRLIRDKNDKGNLYICDSRVYKNNRLYKIKKLLDNSFI